MIKKKLLLDVDEVICDPGFLYLINQFLGTNYKIDDFTEYYIDDVIGSKEKQLQFYQYYLQHNAYDYATLLTDAAETIYKLNEIYDIYIYSACVNPFFAFESGKQFMDKYNYLIKTLPFLDPNKFIFTNSKNMFKADIQIDDRLQNLQGEIPLKILFTSYHNKNLSTDELENQNVIRAGTCSENAWKDIERILIKTGNLYSKK